MWAVRRTAGPSVTSQTTGCGFSFLFRVALRSYVAFYTHVKEADFSYVYFTYVKLLSESKTFSSKGKMTDDWWTEKQGTGKEDVVDQSR